MKVLVTYPLSPELVQSGLGDLVIYRPELASQPEGPMRRALAEHRLGAVLVKYGSAASRIDFPGLHVQQVDGGPSSLLDDSRALGLAERSVMHRQVAERLSSVGISPRASQSLSGSRVTLVGAGIVNLMTALDLIEQGAQVEILDASPDPRSRPSWQQLGATHGGENARMFCFTEADNYSEKGRTVESNTSTVFRRRISEGGWLLTRPETLNRHERAWIDNFQHLPRWRAETFTEDIHGINIASHPLWKQLQLDASHLFEGVGYTPSVLRLYSEAHRAEAAEALHRKLGSLVRVLDANSLSRRHPALGEAVARREIAAALEVEGFSLTIHDFVRKLMAHLEAKGAAIRWNQHVAAIERTDDGLVTGLRVQDGAMESKRVQTRLVRSEHYVLSPGAYGNPLLEGTRSAGKIQGILGLWLRLPNLEPRLRHPVKVHREGWVGEDSNVTLATDATSRPMLILGSGYGFVGSRPLDMSSPEITCLFEALEETARRYFPHPYRRAVGEPWFAESRRACIRPFTSTSLGIFEVLGTSAGGRMVIASGHNTGGFTQAPAVAEAVTATLTGQSHPMQALYDPERGVRSSARSHPEHAVTVGACDGA